jgi:acetyltransferase-like isoleucine patch superfamily enzyme
MKKLLRKLRYDWPLHFVLLATNCLPDSIPFLRLRGWLARPFFGSCGVDLRLGRNLCFYNSSRVSLGSHVYIAYGCVFLALEQIVIGDEVMFGPYSVVASGNHSRVGDSFRYGAVKAEPIWVGSGTWVAAHVCLLAGARVGAGCVVGAGSVVVRGAYPDGSLLIGVPAQVRGCARADGHEIS